jgi:methylated-DNA-[protein]-cysteine S-methyltransferase
MSRNENPTIYVETFLSPLGRIWFASDETGLVCLQMPSPNGQDRLLERVSERIPNRNIEEGGRINAHFRVELEGYFSGSLTAFRTPATPSGTPFQHRVWRLVSKIPYGGSRSYGEIAANLGIPKGPRAVGQANGRNPVPLVIPCHRVIAGGGGLGGYSAGIEQKRFLLEWERRITDGRS